MAILAIAAAGVVTPGARGQGAFGMLPDPITTGELVKYAERLELSPQQQQAMERHHDQYKLEFRGLREGPISDFMSAMGKLQVGGRIPERKVLDQFVADLTDLAKRIERLDERFFRQVQSILTEDQMATLPRVEKARARTRLSASWMTAMVGRNLIDLSELFVRLDLSPEEWERADPRLLSYENRLTSLRRELNDAGIQAFLDIFGALEELGFTGMSEDELEAAENMQEQMMGIFVQVMEKPREVTSRINKLNRRSATSIAAAMDEPNASTFQMRYLQQAYGELSPLLIWNPAVTLTEEITAGLDDDDRQAVLALADNTRRRLDALVNKATKRIDEFNDQRSNFDFDMEVWQKHNEFVQATNNEGREILEDAKERLVAIVGEETAERIMTNADSASQVETALAQAALEAEAAAVAEAEALEDEAWSGDQYIPSRITKMQARHYGKLLGLDEDRLSIMLSMHDDYIDDFDQMKSPDAVVDAVANLWQANDDGSMRFPTSESIDRVYDLRRQALVELQALDEGFFEEVASTLLSGDDASSAAMDRVRLLRRRDTYTRTSFAGISFSFGTMRSQEAEVDLLNLVAAGDRTEAVDAVLREYEVASTEALAKRFDLSFEANRIQERLNVDWQRLAQEGDVDWSSYQERYNEAMGDIQEKLGEINKQLAEINSSACKKVMEALPADKAVAFEDSYRRGAFPEVFNDDLSARPLLASARNLPDLTSDQRAQLSDLAAEYMPAYEECCRQLMDLTQTEVQEFDENMTAEGWEQAQKQMERVATVRFDREELNSRVINRLGQILNPEQASAIGGLPDLTAIESREWWE